MSSGPTTLTLCRWVSLDKELATPFTLAHDKRAVLNLQYSIKHDIVKDWEVMEKEWHHAFCTELSGRLRTVAEAVAMDFASGIGVVY